MKLCRFRKPSGTIQLNIQHAGKMVFEADTNVGQMKRGFQVLADFLFQSQVFPNGAVLLTGTGIIPPEDYTLPEADNITIEISGIGKLQNSVTVV